MRKLLLGVVALESLLLCSGAVLHLTGGLDGLRRRPPPLPVFRPPIHEAVIGDLVRYERRDKESGRVLGYVDYEVKLAFEFEGTTKGREFHIQITERDAGGGSRQRLIRFRPRAVAHGFLPPRLEEEDDFPTGARPVVQRISTARFPFRGGEIDGFLVEAVIPRESLDETAERYWFSRKVPLFGVARWERRGEVLEVHRMEPGGAS